MSALVPAIPTYLDWEGVAKLCSPAGRPVGYHAVSSWWRSGVIVGRHRVKLESVQLPCGRASTQDQVRAFLAEIAERRGDKGKGRTEQRAKQRAAVVGGSYPPKRTGGRVKSDR